MSRTWILLLAVFVLIAVALPFVPLLNQPDTIPVDLPATPPVSGNGDVDPTDFRTVNWMGHWLDEDLRETLVREVAREFRFTHPEIRINLRFPQQIMGKRSKMLTAGYIAEMIRNKRYDWDVIWLDDHIYQYVAEELGDPEWGKKHLVDFRAIPGFASAHKHFIIQDPAYADQTGGILVGPYLEGYYLTLWYNQDLTEKIGIEVNPRGMSFDDFLGYVRQVHEYNKTAETPVAAIYESGDRFGSQMLFQALTRSVFDDFKASIETKRTPGKLAALRKGFEAFEALGKLSPLVKDHRKINWFDTRDYPLRDKCVFYVHGTWMYNHWRAIDPEAQKKMLPAELPVFRDVDHTLGGYIPTWAVFKNSPNRDAAIQLLMVWCRPDVAERWVAYTKNPTGLRGHLEQSTMETDPYEQFQHDMNQQYNGYVHFTANPAYLLGEECRNMEGELDKRLRDLLDGKTTAGNAYDAIIHLCEDKYKE